MHLDVNPKMAGKWRMLFSFLGSKAFLIPFVYRLFPEHTLYCEPFGGSLSVLLNKKESEYEVVNDIDLSLTNLYRVMRDDNLREQLFEKMVKEPICDAMFNKVLEIYRENIGKNHDTPDLDFAWAVAYLYRYSPSGKLHCRLPARHHRITPASLLAVSHRFRHVRIFNRDAIQLIKKLDGANVFFFVDPPYYGATEGYLRRGFGRRWHELLETLARLKGKFLLVAYPNKEADRYGWYRRMVARQRVAFQADAGRKIVYECFWANYSLHEAFDMQRQARWWAPLKEQ